MTPPALSPAAPVDTSAALMAECVKWREELREERRRAALQSAELRERNSDLSYMAGERDILLAAIEKIIDYDDGTKLLMHGECGSIALKTIEDLLALRNRKDGAA